MWHLILPPFIIISGIGLLLWFLSRRMDDPSFLARVKSARGEVSAVSRSRSLSRKAFFLKLLEKSASKFKTNSLRLHNFFQFSLERLRAKRKALDEMRREVGKAIPTPEVESSPKPGWRRFGFRRNAATAERTDDSDSEYPIVETEPVSEEKGMPERPDAGMTEDIPETATGSGPSVFGIFRKGRTISEPVRETVFTPVSLPEEPVLKRTITRPEGRKRNVSERKNPQEEKLIARIAENPRDAAAYEDLGDLYLAAENMQDAKACYRQVLKLHPTNRAVKLKIRKVERFFEENVS